MAVKRTLVLLCIIYIYLFSFSETKPSKKRHQHKHLIAKCTKEFLWEALVAAGKGNQSATVFLSNELNTLGFTKDGIRSKSVAANWQSKLNKIQTESVFSNLQKLGMIDLTENTEVEIRTAASIKKAEKSSFEVNMKHLVKAINKLYENADDDVRAMKIRNKRLKRILKKFLSDELLCADKKSTRKPPEKKNRKKIPGVDSTMICLHMVKELMDRGLCEEVNESFHWTYVQVEKNYKSKSSSMPVAVTVEVP